MMHDLDLYQEYYTGTNRADAQWALIFSDDPAEKEKLEGILKMTQAGAVDDFIEGSCWSDDLPNFKGNKGDVEERLYALRLQYLLQNAKPSMQMGHTLLTPLEQDFYRLVYEMEKICTDATLKKRAQFVLKDADRVVERARPRLWGQLDGWRKNLVGFVENYLAKDNPELADAMLKEMAEHKKNNARGKRRKK